MRPHHPALKVLLVGGGPQEDALKAQVAVAGLGDCFIFTTASSRLCYYVGGEVITLAHLDRPMYMLGYLTKQNRVYLMDRHYVLVSYELLVSVLEYQTAIVREDYTPATMVLDTPITLRDDAIG